MKAGFHYKECLYMLLKHQVRKKLRVYPNLIKIRISIRSSVFDMSGFENNGANGSCTP